MLLAACSNPFWPGNEIKNPMWPIDKSVDNDETPIEDVITTGINAPIAGEKPVTEAPDSEGYIIGPIIWEPADDPFKADTKYGVTIEIEAKEGFDFKNFVPEDIPGAEAEWEIIEGSGGRRIRIRYTFDSTSRLISDFEITGITRPVVGEPPPTEVQSDSDDFTIVGSITWEPADELFKEDTDYTATIELEAKDGYTFYGYEPELIDGATGVEVIPDEELGWRRIRIRYIFAVPPPLNDVNVDITVIGISDAEIILSYNDFTVIQGDPESEYVLNIINDIGAASYQWWYGGVKISDESGITINGSEYTKLGLHSLTLVVYLNGKPYSARIEFDVVAGGN